MIVTREVLLSIKEIIEQNVKLDPSLSDVIINYKIKETDKPNFLNIQIK